MFGWIGLALGVAGVAGLYSSWRKLSLSGPQVVAAGWLMVAASLWAWTAEAGKQAIFSVYRIHFGHFGGMLVKVANLILGLALPATAVFWLALVAACIYARIVDEDLRARRNLLWAGASVMLVLVAGHVARYGLDALGGAALWVNLSTLLAGVAFALAALRPTTRLALVTTAGAV
ncbi:hypothetical protein FV139_11050 [Parahaliea maris]|uniref:Uncharacterized protein n=1 Tax=Parahaliea maris TaxID=2716870 RepID=A0A5C8ZZV1_9GAMM|nr:hypothetical protein [Parahaliea maris]TXS94133.1 hypothetical protein FV139_11050 [Parahaliea maris]